eukprot:405581-Pyramimonas_sp.AAC.1
MAVSEMPVESIAVRFCVFSRSVQESSRSSSLPKSSWTSQLMMGPILTVPDDASFSLSLATWAQPWSPPPTSELLPDVCDLLSEAQCVRAWPSA